MTIDSRIDPSLPGQPLTETEILIAALWSEVLQTPRRLIPTDDFFALGGNSMAMVMLEYRVQEEFSKELPAGVVLGAPTLRELAALVDAERNTFLACDSDGA